MYRLVVRYYVGARIVSAGSSVENECCLWVFVKFPGMYGRDIRYYVVPIVKGKSNPITGVDRP